MTGTLDRDAILTEGAARRGGAAVDIDAINIEEGADWVHALGVLVDSANRRRASQRRRCRGDGREAHRSHARAAASGGAVARAPGPRGPSGVGAVRGVGVRTIGDHGAAPPARVRSRCRLPPDVAGVPARAERPVRADGRPAPRRDERGGRDDATDGRTGGAPDVDRRARGRGVPPPAQLRVVCSRS